MLVKVCTTKKSLQNGLGHLTGLLVKNYTEPLTFFLNLSYLSESTATNKFASPCSRQSSPFVFLLRLITTSLFSTESNSSAPTFSEVFAVLEL